LIIFEIIYVAVNFLFLSLIVVIVSINVAIVVYLSPILSTFSLCLYFSFYKI